MGNVIVMNMKTYKNFYNNMIKKSSKVEDPISLALDFYNTDVVIDENVGDWNVEVFDIDLYCDIMAENGLNILYARDLEWGEFYGLE